MKKFVVFVAIGALSLTACQNGEKQPGDPVVPTYSVATKHPASQAPTGPQRQFGAGTYLADRDIQVGNYTTTATTQTGNCDLRLSEDKDGKVLVASFHVAAGDSIKITIKKGWYAKATGPCIWKRI